MTNHQVLLFLCFMALYLLLGYAFAYYSINWAKKEIVKRENRQPYEDNVYHVVIAVVTFVYPVVFLMLVVRLFQKVKNKE